jgi:hypothetical protein
MSDPTPASIAKAMQTTNHYRLPLDLFCEILLKDIERLHAANANLGNAAAIVYSHFTPKSGLEETAKALLKMELGLKD